MSPDPKSSRHQWGFRSIQDQVTDVFIRRSDQDIGANFNAARTQALTTRADVAGVTPAT
jgi:hypothetical protein